MFSHPSYQREYENMAALPHKRYLTEKEYDDMCERAGDDRELMHHVLNLAALEANAGEWYRAWFDRDIFDSRKHTPEYLDERLYWIDKGIACGIADTAEEAERYFKDNK